jgi:hypothetical protein
VRAHAVVPPASCGRAVVLERNHRIEAPGGPANLIGARVAHLDPATWGAWGSCSASSEARHRANNAVQGAIIFAERARIALDAPRVFLQNELSSHRLKTDRRLPMPSARAQAELCSPHFRLYELDPIEHCSCSIRHRTTRGSGTRFGRHRR